MLDEGYRPVPAVKQIISLSGEKKRRVVIHSPNDLCTSSRHKPDMAGQKGFVNGMVASHLLCHSGTINRHSLNGA
ncbi:hypothetical protein QP699_09100, partial [Klebsiella michiganensis]|nr:hypothetical protein [Klebsiella michiganensis]